MRWKLSFSEGERKDEGMVVSYSRRNRRNKDDGIMVWLDWLDTSKIISTQVNKIES
jgi:hypothetical protein